jgi:transcription elongation factor Elf1
MKKVTKCPQCGSENVRKTRIGSDQHESKATWRCEDCGKIFYCKPLQKIKPQPEETEENDFDAFSEDPDSSNAEEDDYPAIF